MLLWIGKSKFNKKEIACILTGVDKPTTNVKTGNLLQTWFIDASKNPIDVSQNTPANKAHSVCNKCALINNGCYVNLGQAVLNIYRKFKAGGYKKVTDFNIFKGRKVRFGSYGEGILLPFRLFKKICSLSDGWTAYTHNHHIKKYDKFKDYMMASVESLEQAQKCWKNNWRTFRIVRKIEEKTSGEIICPATEYYFQKTHKKIQCSDCMLCCGNASKSPKSIVIVAHGNAAKLQSINKYLEEMSV